MKQKGFDSESNQKGFVPASKHIFIAAIFVFAELGPREHELREPDLFQNGIRVLFFLLLLVHIAMLDIGVNKLSGDV